MNKHITAIACICAFTAGTAMAGEQQQQGKFKMLDANQDGYISAEEAGANERLRKQWQSADRDGDNRIDQSEFSALELQPQTETAE